MCSSSTERLPKGIESGGTPAVSWKEKEEVLGLAWIVFAYLGVLVITVFFELASTPEGVAVALIAALAVVGTIKVAGDLLRRERRDQTAHLGREARE
jgi:hypothetical protein